MTPAINLLRQQDIAHRVLSYDHDPAAASYGREAVDKLGLAAASVFKTLLAASETNELLVAIVPVAGQLDLKALAAALGALAFAALPYKLGLVAAIVLGLAAGAWTVRRLERAR